ncbi:putative aquaporin [Helianthus annuus]|nr:putative aquaporin [Helianthus annuus]
MVSGLFQLRSIVSKQVGPTEQPKEDKDKPGLEVMLQKVLQLYASRVLSKLGSDLDLTGGCMNPADVVGWAYALGVHKTKEHIVVYWFAPIEATLLVVWTFSLLVRRPNQRNRRNIRLTEGDSITPQMVAQNQSFYIYRMKISFTELYIIDFLVFHTSCIL